MRDGRIMLHCSRASTLHLRSSGMPPLHLHLGSRLDRLCGFCWALETREAVFSSALPNDLVALPPLQMLRHQPGLPMDSLRVVTHSMPKVRPLTGIVATQCWPQTGFKPGVQRLACGDMKPTKKASKLPRLPSPSLQRPPIQGSKSNSSAKGR